MLEQTQKVDTSHCFQGTCMQELRRVVSTTGAQIILSSSWRKQLVSLYLQRVFRFLGVSIASGIGRSCFMSGLRRPATCF